MRAPVCDPDYGGRHKWAGRRGLDVLDDLPGRPLVLFQACAFCGVERISRYLGGHRTGAVLGYRAGPCARAIVAAGSDVIEGVRGGTV